MADTNLVLSGEIMSLIIFIREIIFPEVLEGKQQASGLISHPQPHV